jgi:toxin ParE1/3/4
MRVELSRFVEEDLDAIASYIAQDNPRRAVTFLREIKAKIRAIGRRPALYRLRPEIGEGARMALVGRHAILFRVVADKIVRIERIVYGGRNLPALFRQDP